MENQFVSYELALKLKELGFKERCIGLWYWREDMFRLGEEEFYVRETSYFEVPEHHILAPLWCQAFDWFREKHSLLSFIDIDNSYRIYWNNVKHDLDLDSKRFETYQEARQACLEKLIELVEDDKNK